MERVLIRFAKEDLVRFIGHLDLMRMLERAIRRAHFPVAYSQGFNPRPRMASASALTLGATSDWELCQLELERDVADEELVSAVQRLRTQLPRGLRVLAVWPLPVEKKNPYLQVRSAGYRLSFRGAGEEPDARRSVEEVISGTAVELDELAVASGDLHLKLTVPVGDHGGVRIRELVASLEAKPSVGRLTGLHRHRLWCEQDPETISISLAREQIGPSAAIETGAPAASGVG